MESILFKCWSQEVMRGHDMVKHFYFGFSGGNLFFKSFQVITNPKKFIFTYKVI
jgi:hypothetical protein